MKRGWRSCDGLEADVGVYLRLGRRGAAAQKRVSRHREPDPAGSDQGTAKAHRRRAEELGGDRQEAREESPGRGGEHRQARYNPRLAPKARSEEVRRFEEAEIPGPTDGRQGDRRTEHAAEGEGFLIDSL